MRLRITSSFVLAGWLAGAAAVAPRLAYGQAGGAPATTPAAAVPVKRVAITKSVFGDAGMIINARSDGFIEIAAAGPKKTVLLQLRTLAARAWVDSAYRMLRARPRRSKTPRTYRADVEEAASSGTMALTRRVTDGESSYSLFFSDDPLAGISIPIERGEADVFVALVRKAVATATKLAERPDSAAKDSSKRSATKKPAAKKPAAKKPAANPVARPPATSAAKPPASP